MKLSKELRARIKEETGQDLDVQEVSLPKDYTLDTLENCRELLSDVLYSATAGEMELQMAKFAADIAKKAADTLIKGDRDEAVTSKILAELAQVQPALSGKPSTPAKEVVLEASVKKAEKIKVN